MSWQFSPLAHAQGTYILARAHTYTHTHTNTHSSLKGDEELGMAERSHSFNSGASSARKDEDSVTEAEVRTRVNACTHLHTYKGTCLLAPFVFLSPTHIHTQAAAKAADELLGAPPRGNLLRGR